MRKFHSITAFVIALCLALSVCCALADQTMEGDANVDQRNYPSTAPFIHQRELHDLKQWRQRA